MEHPPALPTSSPRLKATDWVIVGGVVVSLAVGVALLALTAVLYEGWLPGVPSPNYSQGISTADLASLIVAGSTALLAAFTALLAFTTRRSIAATQLEANIADQALTTANRQADIAQEQLSASWRPLLAEPRSPTVVTTTAFTSQDFTFEVGMANIGRGPAFLVKALLSVGTALNVSREFKPSIVGVGDEVRIVYKMLVTSEAGDKSIAEAMTKREELTVTAFYRDISGTRAWGSKGRFVSRGSTQWLLTEVQISTAAPEVLT